MFVFQILSESEHRHEPPGTAIMLTSFRISIHDNLPSDLITSRIHSRWSLCLHVWVWLSGKSTVKYDGDYPTDHYKDDCKSFQFDGRQYLFELGYTDEELNQTDDNTRRMEAEEDLWFSCTRRE